MPVAAEREHSGTADRRADAHYRALPGLLLRGIHDVHRPDDGNFRDAVFVRAGGILSLCGAMETAPSAKSRTRFGANGSHRLER